MDIQELFHFLLHLTIKEKIDISRNMTEKKWKEILMLDFVILVIRWGSDLYLWH